MSAAKTFSRRLFLTYQELIEGRAGRRDLDGAVKRYASANKGVDLEQRITFKQWLDETSSQQRPTHAR